MKRSKKEHISKISNSPNLLDQSIELNGILKVTENSTSKKDTDITVLPVVQKEYDEDSDDLELPQMYNLENESVQSNTMNSRLMTSQRQWTTEETKAYHEQLNETLRESIPKSIPFAGEPSHGRTVSVALPSSIVSNCQSFELRAYLVGQIARTLTVFGVDEIVIFEDSATAVNFGSVYNVEQLLSIYDDVKEETDEISREAIQHVTNVSICNTTEKETNSSSILQPDLKLTTSEEILHNESTNHNSFDNPHIDHITTTANDDDDCYDESDLPKGIEFKNDIKWSQSLKFFVLNLCYLETPQYLRKMIFKMDSNLRMAGLQNPLDSPHHMRTNEWLPYREGVIVSHCDNEKATSSQVYSLVECGLPLFVRVPGRYPINRRVTIKLHPSGQERCNKRQINGKFKKQYNYNICKRKGQNNKLFVMGQIVRRREPVDLHGLYWGYQVRAAKSLKNAIQTSPFNNEKYDLIIGTSERGTIIDLKTFKLTTPNFKHCLIVFGGIGGIEECIEDEQSEIPICSPSKLFEMYVNICSAQKSRTIRAEEALTITLSILRPIFFPTT